MEEFNMVPVYRNGMGEISPGMDIPVPLFCQTHCSKDSKCRAYYDKLECAEPGVYQCPFGFSSYVFDVEDSNTIFTSLRIEKLYNRNRLLPKIKNEGKEYRELTLANLKRYAEAYKAYYTNQNHLGKYKNFIDDIFHDIRKFNQQLKIKNDRILRKSQQSNRLGDILEASKSIQVTSWFLTLRLNNHDFIYNEEIMQTDIKIDYNIFRIIDKVRLCMMERAQAKNIRIRLQAQSQCRDMQAYDCIELLPFLLLDNAIKYAPNDSDIHINIIEKADMQIVNISSLGPYVNAEEIAKLTTQGYRGDNAIRLTEDGMGIGLYTAQCICNLNNIQIDFSSGPNITKHIKGIDYANFSVDIRIKL